MPAMPACRWHKKIVTTARLNASLRVTAGGGSRRHECVTVFTKQCTKDLLCGMSLHRFVMLQVPLHDELSGTVDVNVPWGVIALPPHKGIIASAYLAH